MRSTFLVSALLASTAVAAPTYWVTDLHTTDAFDLTADGSVFVQSRRPLLEANAVSVIRNGEWFKPALPARTYVRDVSDNGTILAESPGFGVFVQSPDGRRRTLQKAAGSVQSYPIVVNDRGVAAGTAVYPLSGRRVSLAVWNSATASLSGTAVAGVAGINNYGVVSVDTSQPAGGPLGTVRSGTFTPLPGSSSFQTEALDLNDAGTVVGAMYDVDRGRRWAGVWTSAGVRRVEPLPGHAFAMFSAINDAGLAVGRSGMTATLWDGQTLTELNAAVQFAGDIYLGSAIDINDAGQILAAGQIGNRYTTVLLTPQPALARSTAVPEPAFASVALVTGAMLIRRRRTL